ncbi:E3 ubiquitin-protein ligase MARCHF3-like [Ixodes scapularis]|uniref:E3 ubiquitin-protein ligase MARCHF3-like n=1 Tax=Ixodes scapularis TaxID=6945 RepID=UPI001C391B01|nr:E3 ubiquitin-protein ligase MARCHF3-like [Ixodes scapularis]
MDARGTTKATKVLFRTRPLRMLAGGDDISTAPPVTSPRRLEPSREELCRFCATGGDQEELVTPCCCEGFVSQTHRSCLEKRILQDGVSRCYHCNFRYQYKLKTRSACHWFRSPEYRHDVFQLIAMLVQYICDTLVIGIAVFKAIHFVAQAPLVAAIVTVLGCGSCTVFWLAYLSLDLWTFYTPLRRWIRNNTSIVLLLPASKAEDVHSAHACSTDELR